MFEYLEIETLIKTIINDYTMKFRNYLLILLSSFSLFACTGDLKDEIDELRSEIEALKNGEVNSLSTQISKIQATVSGLESTSTSLKSAINELTDSQNDSKELLLESSSKIDALIDALYTYSEGLDEKQSDWTRATFSTLSYQSETEKILSSIRKIVNSVDSNIAAQIKNNEETVKSWVGETLTGYYTSAEVQSALEDIKKESNNEIASAFEKANDEMVAEYKAAITAAISQNEGKIMAVHKASIDEVNTKINELSIKIDALAERIEKLENRITSISKITNLFGGEYNERTAKIIITKDSIWTDICYDARQIVIKINGHINADTAEANILYSCPAYKNTWENLISNEASIDSILSQSDGDLLFVSFRINISAELLSADYPSAPYDLSDLYHCYYKVQIKDSNNIVSSDLYPLGYANANVLNYRFLENLISRTQEFNNIETVFEEISYARFVEKLTEAKEIIFSKSASTQDEIDQIQNELVLQTSHLYPKDVDDLYAQQKGVNKGNQWAILYDGGPKWAVAHSGVSLWENRQSYIDEWNVFEQNGSIWRLPNNTELEKLCDPSLVYWQYDPSNASFIVYRRYSYDIEEDIYRSLFSYDSKIPHIIIEKEHLYEFSSDYLIDNKTGAECPYVLKRFKDYYPVQLEPLTDDGNWPNPDNFWGAVRLVCE